MQHTFFKLETLVTCCRHFFGLSTRVTKFCPPDLHFLFGPKAVSALFFSVLQVVNGHMLRMEAKQPKGLRNREILHFCGQV